MLVSKFLSILLMAMTASFTLTNALCPSGADTFNSYVRLDLDFDGTTLGDLKIGDVFSRTFNEMASLGCDYDHRRIHLSVIENSDMTVGHGKTTLSVNMKALVYYKGMTGMDPNFKPTNVPSLFGPRTFRPSYVEEECSCGVIGVDPTGVSVEAFTVALQNAITTALNKKVKVTDVEEVAVSTAQHSTVVN